MNSIKSHVFQLFGLRDVKDNSQAEPIKAQIGNHLLQISLISRFSNNPAVSPEELSSILGTKGTSKHIAAFVKSRIPELSGVTHSRISEAFYTALCVSNTSEWEGIIDINRSNKIIDELVKFSEEEPSHQAVLDKILTVEEYNKGYRGPVRLTYMTGAGNLKDIVCEPTEHHGDILLKRLTKTAATKTIEIAVWSCCGLPLAITSSKPCGYEVLHQKCPK